MTDREQTILEKMSEEIAISITNKIIANPDQVAEVKTALGFDVRACMSEGQIRYFYSPAFSEAKAIISAILDSFNESLREYMESQREKS